MASIRATPAEDALASAREAVDLGNSQFTESYAKLDPREYTSIFAPDGVDLQAGGIVVRGRAAILASVSKFMLAMTGPAQASAMTQDL